MSLSPLCTHTLMHKSLQYTHRAQIYTSAGAECVSGAQQLVLAVNSSAGSMESGGCVSAGPASQSTPRSPVPALPLIPIKMLSRCLAWERQALFFFFFFSAAIFICMLLTAGPQSGIVILPTGTQAHSRQYSSIHSDTAKCAKLASVLMLNGCCQDGLHQVRKAVVRFVPECWIFHLWLCRLIDTHLRCFVKSELQISLQKWFLLSRILVKTWCFSRQSL